MVRDTRTPRLYQSMEKVGVTGRRSSSRWATSTPDCRTFETEAEAETVTVTESETETEAGSETETEADRTRDRTRGRGRG